MGLGFVWLWAFLSSAHYFAPFSSIAFPAVPFCYFCCDVIRPKPAGPLWVCCLFFSQWLSMVFRLFIKLLASSCVPFISSWSSLAHLLSLGFLGPFPNFAFPWDFTNSFRLPWPNYIIFHSLGSWTCHQPPYFLCLHYFVLAMTYSHFSTLHIAHGFATSLSPGSFRPICFLKAHLFMS